MPGFFNAYMRLAALSSRNHFRIPWVGLINDAGYLLSVEPSPMIFSRLNMKSYAQGTIIANLFEKIISKRIGDLKIF